jgi:hypothetical protein
VALRPGQVSVLRIRLRGGAGIRRTFSPERCFSMVLKPLGLVRVSGNDSSERYAACNSFVLSQALVLRDILLVYL